MAITRVQSAVANTAATAATSKSLVFGSTLTSGNIVILAVCGDSNIQAFTSITGTNVQFSYIHRVSTNSATVYLGIGRVFVSATNTVTVTCNSASNIAIAGAEYSGSGLLRLDKTASAIGSSTSPASGATSSTNSAVELWIGAIGARGTNANTFSAPTNSFVIVNQTNTTVGTANTDRSVALLERIVSATGTANVGATMTTNNWSAVVATFEQTPSGGTSGGSYIYGG